jgi:outer membrane protein OmpA-like peptidoglycan-associated protein
MPFNRMCQYTVIMVSIVWALSGCVNNGQKLPVSKQGILTGAAVGAGLGAAVGSAAGNAALGAVLGGSAGSVIGIFRVTPAQIIREIIRYDIQYVKYGDTNVLIVPTDKYFEFNSHRFSDQCYIGLMNIARLLRFYPCSKFYVAGFTDEIGTRHHKNQLSQSRADAMITFLWAHHFRAQRLSAEGYGDKFDIGDNHLIHGSAYNRRIEIQWVDGSQLDCVAPPKIEAVDMK